MARLVVLVTSSTLVPQILEHLAKHGGEWEGIAALARELGANYPWTWQVLVQMERAGVIRIDRSRRPYVLRLSGEDGYNDRDHSSSAIENWLDPEGKL